MIKRQSKYFTMGRFEWKLHRYSKTIQIFLRQRDSKTKLERKPRACEMAQRVKVLTTKPDHSLKFDTQAPHGGRGESTPTGRSLTSTHTLWHVHARHTHIGAHTH